MIRCFYVCGACSSERVFVDVPTRRDEDVVAWLRDVATPALVLDHHARNPRCRPATFREVGIPVLADRIGAVDN